MKAIIPAAGIGTRLRPHTYTLPKALLYVAGRPIIAHILEDIKRLDLSSVIVIVGYKGELVEQYVADEYRELNPKFVYQKTREGIGHAVHQTRELADGGEPVLIVLGDTILRSDLTKITVLGTNALGVKEVEDPRRFGVCELKEGKIVRLVEKPAQPPSNLALVGLYYVQDSSLLFRMLREQIEADHRTRGEYQITDALQMMIDRGAEFVPFAVDDWFDCGKPEALLETNRRLLVGRDDVPHTEDSVVIPPVAIAPSARIVRSIVGPFVSIAAEATVENAVVRDSVLDRGSDVKDCLLEGSIIGSGAVVKGGFQRLNIGDSSEVTSR
jgi:glucose-1-phosphate thymidylyltransferase